MIRQRVYLCSEVFGIILERAIYYHDTLFIKGESSRFAFLMYVLQIHTKTQHNRFLCILDITFIP